MKCLIFVSEFYAWLNIILLSFWLGFYSKRIQQRCWIWQFSTSKTGECEGKFYENPAPVLSSIWSLTSFFLLHISIIFFVQPKILLRWSTKCCTHLKRLNNECLFVSLSLNEVVGNGMIDCGEIWWTCFWGLSGRMELKPVLDRWNKALMIVIMMGDGFWQYLDRITKHSSLQSITYNVDSFFYFGFWSLA